MHIPAHYTDIDGKPNKRTPNNRPYNYEPFLLYKKETHDQQCQCIYTDHFHFKYPNYRYIQKDVFGKDGDDYSQFSSKNIEIFLRKLLNEGSLELTCIMQHCNASNGFPLWQLFYRIPSKTAPAQ